MRSRKQARRVKMTRDEVMEMNDEHMVLDANPPLAGQELIFDIELVEIA